MDVERIWSALKPDERGLVTAVVQHAESGQVLMVAMVNREALARTLERRRVTFWSRSRSCIWEKGETSNNTLELVELWVDCDGDALLVRALPSGPTCHTGRASCFYRVTQGDAELRLVSEGPPSPSSSSSSSPILERLTGLIEERKAGRGTTNREGKSYVRSLIERGPAAISAKIEEEAGELSEALCAEVEDLEHIKAEAADLLFHTMVGLAAKGLDIAAVRDVLGERLGLSGIDEKARRSVTSEP